MPNVSVLIVDQKIESPGILANLGFVLGLTAGRHLPEETFGHEVKDGDGDAHNYLTKIGHYVREANQTKLQTLRKQFAQSPEVLLVDYTEAAAPASYEAYESALLSQKGEQIIYRAIYVYGPEEMIVPLTKNLSRRS